MKFISKWKKYGDGHRWYLIHNGKVIATLVHKNGKEGKNIFKVFRGILSRKIGRNELLLETEFPNLLAICFFVEDIFELKHVKRCSVIREFRQYAYQKQS